MFIAIIVVIASFIAGVICTLILRSELKLPQKKKTLQEMEEYFTCYDEKCKYMNTLSDKIFEKWVKLQTELKTTKRKRKENLKLV